MAYQIQGVDLPSIFLAAQQARQNEIQLQEMERQRLIADHLPQARAAYFRGDPSALQRFAPEEYASQLAVATEAERKREQLRINADAAEKEEAYRQAQLGNATLDEDARAVLNATDLRRGTPEFAQAYKAQRARRLAEEERMRKAGAVNVNVGEKTLPTTVVQESADAMTALQILDDIGASFDQNVPNAGFISQMKARGQQYVPNTSAAGYLNDAASAAQVVGTFLEGGKLGEADLPRYKSMLPMPGDDENTKTRKVEALRRKIRLRAANRTGALKDAGYRTADTAGNPELPPAPPPQMAPPPMQPQPMMPPQQALPPQQMPPQQVAPPQMMPVAPPITQSASLPVPVAAPMPVQPMTPAQQAAAQMLPELNLAEPDLSGANSAQTSAPRPEMRRRDGSAPAAPQNVAETAKSITARGLRDGKNPNEILKELKAAGMPAEQEAAVRQQLNRAWVNYNKSRTRSPDAKQ